MNEPRPAPPSTLGFGSLLGIGVLLRVWAFLLRSVPGSLGNDEAGLALNIVGRGWDAVARPFVYQQSAPYLYMLASKAALLAFGPNERALRLLSVVCGCLLLPTLLMFVRAVSGWAAALFALALLIPNPSLLRFATEFKPFSLDALISSLVCLLTWRVLSDREQARAAVSGVAALGIVGLIAPWCSLPAIFVLSGSLTALAVDAWQQDDRRAAALHVPLWLSLAWLASFGAHHFSFVRGVAHASVYTRHELARDTFSVAELSGHPSRFLHLFEVFIAPGSGWLCYVAAALWAWGVVSLWRSQRAICALLLTPWLLVFLTAMSPAAHAYALPDHCMLFMLPMLLTPVVTALVELAQWRGMPSQLAAAALAVLFCIGPSRILARALTGPAASSSIDHVARYLREHYRAGDKLYVEKQVVSLYTFYARRAQFSADFPSPDDRLDDPRPSYETLDNLRGNKRVWIVVPALINDTPLGEPTNTWALKAETLITNRLHNVAKARALDVLDGGATRLYLYDLSNWR